MSLYFSVTNLVTSSDLRKEKDLNTKAVLTYKGLTKIIQMLSNYNTHALP